LDVLQLLGVSDLLDVLDDGSVPDAPSVAHLQVS
jgi:hypothetical protein